MAIRNSTLHARLLCGAAVVALTISASAAHAQEQKHIEIAPQALASALHEFGVQSGHQVLFKPSTAETKTSPGVTIDGEVDVALAQLLSGTGMSFRRAGDTFLIEPAGASDPQSGSAAGDGADQGTVQALIVTAQKREENIQDVPIAMSAFTQEDLTRSQVAGGPDLITQVPNMTFTKTNFSSYSIQLRGIGTQAISATTDPGVAVAFNNTPFIQNRFFEQEFYDLQRVEVLRGPQGTLYGRNATAGVVNIISQKPRFVAEAKLSGDVSNYNSSRLEGMINIPLVEDKVALRLAGAWTKRDGYDTNQLTGNQIDGRDLWSTRLSLRVAPNDRIDTNLIWEHFQENDDRLRSGKQLCKRDVVTQVGDVPVQFFEQQLNSGGLDAPWVAVQPRFSTGCQRASLYSPDSFQTPNGASLPYYVPIGAIGFEPTRFDAYASTTQSRDLRVIESTVDPDYRAKADLGELQVSWHVTDNLTLASETAYAADFVWSKQDFNRFNTASGAFCTRGTDAGTKLCNPVGTPPPPGGPVDTGLLTPDGFYDDPQVGLSDRLTAVDLSTARSRQFNQEFRLSSDFDGPFNFSLGANFTRFDLNAKYYVFINSLGFLSRGAYDANNPTLPCSTNGLLSGDPSPTSAYTFFCILGEPNSIENIQDQGHNYFLSTNPYRLISYAAFGEAYYNITDSLKVTAGLRWTVDKKRAPRIPSWTVAGESRGYPVLEVINQEWREPTGRLAIDWKPHLSFTDETLLYASYSHGYKAGGSNPPPYIGNSAATVLSLTRPKTFAPEFVDAFELGAKNTLLDGKATLNLAAFYYDYKDYQISEIVDRSAFNQNYDATIWGLELEADWRPLENLKLGFKGGYENTRIADGQEAIDLMDRTAGNPDWIVVRPFPTYATNCVLPTALFTHRGLLPQAPGTAPIDLGTSLSSSGAIFDIGEQASNTDGGGCEFAYIKGWDPVSHAPYEPYPGVAHPSIGQTWMWGGSGAAYPGWNPAWAPNNGEGFTKPLGGNQLPNAPHFTGTITVDYTLPLPNQWLMTLHTDLYAQSNSYWRIFNDNAYDKLHPYFTMNLAAIFTNEDAGWKVMAYVKNVLDRDSITGAFLNSDDTGLTTNVFLTEPRLYGLRVTKDWSGGPLWGSFGARHDGPYPLTIEIGGQVQRHDAPNDPLAPSFLDQYSPSLNPLADQQQKLDWGDGREVKLTYQPGPWKVVLGARFGKTNGSMPWSERREVADTYVSYAWDSPVYNYTISTTTDREEHTIVDFAVGKDTGIGLLGENGSSTLSAGVRYADFSSTTHAQIFGPTNWYVPDHIPKYPEVLYNTHDRYVANLNADREFKGAGPVLNWEAATGLLGNRDVGVLNLDWMLSGGALFGTRKTTIAGEEIAEYIREERHISHPKAGTPTTSTTTPVNYQRSKSVTVPTYGASLGLSYKVDRFAIGAGYRWERYQNAIDGGYTESKGEDRTIDGPYFKVSVGFGG